MKLVGVLCWYNESPSWLAACVASLGKIGVDHVVALDGAYALFPEGRAKSNLLEVEAIYMGADAAGIGVTVEQPATVWYGNEPEKRSRLFQLATSMCTTDDWLVAIDADEIITHGTPRIKDELEASSALAVNGWIEQWWDDVQGEAKRAEVARMFPHPAIFGHLQTRFFRALPSLRCDTTHFTYVAEHEGVSYSLRLDKAGRDMGYKDAPVLTPDSRVVFEHRDPLRDAARKLAKSEYYAKRNELGVERVTTRSV